MNQIKVDKFLTKLMSDSLVYSPMKKEEDIVVGRVENVEQVDWSGAIPKNTFKNVFLPAKEVLAINNKSQFDAETKRIAWGMNILDLQAFSMFEQVFEKDAFFQKRRQNTYIVGFTNGIEDDLRKYKVFHQKYEEDVLEHLIFDVFIERQKNGNFIFFSGSEKGQRLLEENGIKDFENIEFAGLVPEEGIDPRILENRKAVEFSEKHPMWNELAKICLACGKCSINCPTCFCFDQQDEPTIDGVKKTRQWTTCFYPEFSKVAGGFKELDSIKKKLYYWYYHKFVRIPDEFSYYGCVSCMRCYKTCPVGINIAKNLQQLKKKNA